MTLCKNQQRDDQSPHWQEKGRIENLPTSSRHRNDLRDVLGLCGKLCVPLEKFSQPLRTFFFLRQKKTKKTLQWRTSTGHPAEDSERTHQLGLHDVRVCVPPGPWPRIFSVESVIILVLTCQNQNTVVRMTRITYQVRNGVTVRLIWDITISILSKIAKISESVICESLAWNRYLGVLLSGTV